MRSKQHGFSFVEVIIVLVVVCIIVALGYAGWNAIKKNTDENSVETTKTTTQSQEAEPIESEDDLDKADKTLDDTSLTDDESAQAEAQTNF